MALRTAPDTHSFDLWRQKYNLLAADVGDLAALTTGTTSSVVAVLNYLDDRIDNIVVDSITLPNDTFFLGDSATTGTIDIVKVNTDDELEFGADIANLNIVGGTITSLTSPLSTGVGGTGANTPAGARTSLGLAIGTDVQAFSSKLSDIAGMAATAGMIPVGTGSAFAGQSGSTARASLGLAIGTDVQAWDLNLDQIAALTPTNNIFMVGDGSSWQTRDATVVKSILGVTPGVNVQVYSATLTSIASITPTVDNFIVANGTGWVGANSTAVRTILGLVVGTNVQAWDLNLDQIAALTPTSNGIMVGNGSAWVTQSGSTARASLGLSIGTDVQGYSAKLANIAALAANSNDFIVGSSGSYVAKTLSETRAILLCRIGTDVQAWDTDLDAIAALGPTSNNFIVGNGSAWVKKTGSEVLSIISAQPLNSRLTEISSQTVSDNYFLVGSTASGWLSRTAAQARSSMGAAAAGANSDITALTGISYSSFNPTITGNGSIVISSQANRESAYARLGPFYFIRFTTSFTLSGTGQVLTIPLPFSAGADDTNDGYVVNIIDNGVSGIGRYRCNGSALIVFPATGNWTGGSCGINISAVIRA